MRTSADSPGEDPCAGGDGRFDQPLPKHLLELGLQLKVLQPSVDGDEQSGKLQLPVLHHQVEQRVRLGVVGNPDVLRTQTQKHRLLLQYRAMLLYSTVYCMCTGICLSHRFFINKTSTPNPIKNIYM